MIKQNVTSFYSGTSGLLLPVKNKHFYPAEFKNKSRLNFYASMMNSIEINSSFYKIPMYSTIKKWADDVPEDFKFTFKLSKELTHQKGLAFNPERLKHFMEVISAVGLKKGSLLVQFPPSIRITDLKQLTLLVSYLREFDPEKEWDIAIEFRHVSLYTEQLYGILEAYEMGMVIQDRPPANTPMLENSLNFVYLRFHGPEGDYRGSYEDYLLYEYAEYIKSWLTEGKTVYAYFNNTMGSAVANLFTLRTLINRK